MERIWEGVALRKRPSILGLLFVVYYNSCIINNHVASCMHVWSNCVVYNIITVQSNLQTKDTLGTIYKFNRFIPYREVVLFSEVYIETVI